MTYIKFIFYFLMRFLWSFHILPILSFFWLVKKFELVMHSISPEGYTNNLNTQWRLSADDEQSFIKKTGKKPRLDFFRFYQKKHKFMFLDYCYWLIWVTYYLIVYSIICDYNIRVIFIIRFELLLLLLFAFVPDRSFLYFIIQYKKKKRIILCKFINNNIK